MRENKKWGVDKKRMLNAIKCNLLNIAVITRKWIKTFSLVSQSTTIVIPVRLTVTRVIQIDINEYFRQNSVDVVAHASDFW